MFPQMKVFSEGTLLPLPSDVALGDGYLRLDNEFRVALTGIREPRLERAVNRFAHVVRQLTESRPLASDKSKGPRVAVVVEESSDAAPGTPDDESYALTVSPDRVLLEARKTHGALHGLQTLAQLIVSSPDGYQLPVVRIVDQPRFAWRGLLIDAVRHWMPPEVIKRNLDAMASVKLNVFHWHLTDDQGFRIESRRFPRLHELGSDGNYYTQEEVRSIVEYAWDRGISVVPEFDMPGHTTSWFVGYPGLASASGPYTVSRKFGGHKATMDPTKNGTIELVFEFLSEMVSLFPGRFIHLGGDEVDPEHWQSNAAIRTYMREHSLEGPRDLLVDFHNRIQSFLHNHGRETIGWDPLVAPGLDRAVIIESVRGQRWVAEAIRRGNRAIASSEYYMDAMLPASYHYLKDPFDGEVSDATDEQRALILGGEASMWTEFVTAANVDSRLWPRTAAVAERLWSPREIRDVDDLYRRLPAVSRQLDLIGLAHMTGPRWMQKELAGGSSSTATQTLTVVVEPITLEQRWKLVAHYTTSTPLNRLVDATVPDGQTPRTFEAKVAVFVADPANGVTCRELQGQLQTWVEAHERITSAVARSPLLTEVESVSKALSDVAGVGLACLEALHASDSMTEEERKAYFLVLELASAPRAEVTLAIIPGIRTLLEAVPDATQTRRV
jgi:hexosaminidase